MSTRGTVAAAPREPLLAEGIGKGRLRVICPTYWYPLHATDTQATYVHDINRHLVRRGHLVTVVTPGDPSQSRTDTFDGVEVVRFPMEIPADLTYGRVAQSRVTWLSRFARLAVMANYLEAQYRSTRALARERKADVIHAHWAIPTGPAAVLALSVLAVSCAWTRPRARSSHHRSASCARRPAPSTPKAAIPPSVA